MRDKLLKNLQPLEQREKDLLAKYHEFLKRFAVLDLAEKLRKTADIPDKLRVHIAPKREIFLKMMTSYTKPPAGEEDPVVQYGWNRDDNKDELQTLQTQYLGLTMDCYEMGYVTFCPKWMTFLKEPHYWYQVYSAWLVSKDNLKPWLAKMPSHSSDKGKMSPDVEVMHWANKLTLLKHALARTDAEKAKSLEVKDTVDKINAAVTGYYNYAQTFDEELAKHLIQVCDSA